MLTVQNAAAAVVDVAAVVEAAEAAVRQTHGIAALGRRFSRQWLRAISPYIPAATAVRRAIAAYITSRSPATLYGRIFTEDAPKIPSTGDYLVAVDSRGEVRAVHRSRVYFDAYGQPRLAAPVADGED